MRVATSTVFQQQTNSIDLLEAENQTTAIEISSGHSLQQPSDDPAQINADLVVRATLTSESQQTTNINNATAQLNATDSALSNLTDLLQSAHSLAVQGAVGTLAPSDRQAIGKQVDELLQQAITTANTQFGTTFIFAGTSQSTTPPVAANGSPATNVTFSGNEETQNQLVGNNQTIPVSTTFQQAFNFNAADGSSSVFQVLSSLRDTLNGGLVTDVSANSINHPGAAILGATTTLGTGPVSPFAVPPVTDNGVPPGYTISINNADSNGAQHVQAYTFAPGSTLNNIVAAINANTATTGVTAAFNAQSQKITLTNAGGGSFSVTDVPSPGGTTSGNLTKVLGLAGQADLPQSISTQIGDIQNVLNVALSARTDVGDRINSLGEIGSQVSVNVADNTNVQAGIENVDVGKASVTLSETQTALQAAFATTSQLEGKHLFDFI